MRLLVDLDALEPRHVGAGGDDDVLGLQRLRSCRRRPSPRPCRAPAMRPAPWKASILFFLNRKSTPLTLPSTPSSLNFIIAARSSFGAPTPMPILAERVTGLLEHLGGVQQRLRRDAADVEAGAAEGGALLDHRDLHAELRRADGADIAARAGADDDEIVSHGSLRSLDRHGRACPGHPRLVANRSSKTWMPGTRPGMTEKNHKSSTSRAGSSRHSFTRTRNVTASRPSTMRWS